MVDNEDIEGVFGTYGTKLTTIMNSASSSWSGFTYQGLCAIHYTLALINNNWGFVETRKLNLESYEDFAILDENDLIISFHQCKEYGSAKDWTGECEKMSDKHDYWASKDKLSPNYDKMYFHSNQNNTYACGVEQYVYKTENGLCGPDKIVDLIDQEISEIIIKHGFPGSHEIKRDRLISMIAQKVEELHDICIRTGQRMFDVAASNSISFKQISKYLKDDSTKLNFTEVAITCRSYMIIHMMDRYANDSFANGTKVKDFVRSLEELDIQSLEQFIKRIFPDVDLNADNISVRSKERANTLYNVINDVEKDIERLDLNWVKDGLTLLTPSTLGRDVRSEEHCRNIVNNNYPGDVIRDYRWIVGDVKSKIEDIIETAHTITISSSMDYSDITNPTKVGLLDINSMNNGDY